MKCFKNKFIITVGILIFVFTNNSAAQSCSNCSVYSNSTDSSSYIINQGQTLCLDSNCVFTGSITINGGTLCNRGLLAPKQLQFQSGILYNYNNISLANNLSIGSNCLLDVKDGSNFNISNGSLNLNGGQIENNGVISIIGSINLNTGSFNSYNLINCNSITGNLPINNSGIINTN